MRLVNGFTGLLLAVASGAEARAQSLDIPTTSNVSLPAGASARLATLPANGFGNGAALAVSPDGRFVASAGWSPEVQGKKAIHILNADTGLVERAFPAPGEHLEGLAFSPDGKRLAAAGELLWILDAATGKVLHEIKVLGRTQTISFSADSKTVWAGGMLNSVTVWDVASGKPVREHKPKLYFSSTLRESVATAELSPDGRYLACSIAQERPTKGEWRYTARKFRVEDAATGKELLRLDWLPTRRLAFSPDGRLLAHSGLEFGLYDLETGKALPALEAPLGSKAAPLYFSPDGKNLLSVHLSACKLLLWDVSTAKIVHDITWRTPHKDFTPPESKVAFAPDGKHFYLVDYGRLRKWNTATGAEVLGYIGHTRPVTRLAFTEGGKTLTSWCDQRCCTWDVATWKQTSASSVASTTPSRPEIKEEKYPGKFAALFSPDFKYFLTAVPTPDNQKDVRVWNVRTRREVCRLAPNAFTPCNSFAFSVDGRFFATGGERGYGIAIFEVATGMQRGALRGVPDQQLLTMAFSGDGKCLASGYADGSILIWDINRPLIRKLFPERLAAADLEKCWAALAQEKADFIDEQIWRLVLDPERAVPFLKARLQPLPKVTTKEIRQWIAGLDADSFKEREKHMHAFLSVDELALPELEQALASNPTLEASRRMEHLLEKLQARLKPTEQWRKLRSVEVLERINTAEARQVLQHLAGGAPMARLTEEAQAALRRMGRS